MSSEIPQGSIEPVAVVPDWGRHAPKGAKTVFARMVKEGANVPLFLSQTLVSAMRDVGYNHTTSAVCEFVDNSIESGATEIRVYFNQRGKRGGYDVDLLVLDNGPGMAPNVLHAVMAFGGSMRYDNRKGIGRFGMGMKAAALSVGPALDVYSWQEPGAIYRMVLDTEEIGNDRRNVVELPEPELVGVLPPELQQILTTRMVFPRDGESQEVLSQSHEDLRNELGSSGTILFIQDCDRLTYRTAQTLVEHATKEFARVYRRQLGRGLRLYVNNRAVEPFDPTYSMPEGRHARVEGIKEKRSRLVRTWTIEVPVAEGQEETSPVTLRLFRLPVEDWGNLPRKVLKNDLKVFDGNIVSYMRGDREVHSASTTPFTGKFHTGNNWWRLEIEFTGDLDEAFGININKQGVRPKAYVMDLLKKALRDDLSGVKESIKKFWSGRAAEEAKGKLSEAEKLATEAEALQGTVLPQPEPRTETERLALEEGLRSIAMAVRGTDESLEEALGRVKSSRYLTTFKHDEDAAFYRVDSQHGKVILTLNKAHPFFDLVYRVLANIASTSAAAKESPEAESETVSDPELATEAANALVSLQLLFLSLARTQADMTVNDPEGERERIFDQLRGQWSLNLRTQLMQIHT